MAKNTKKTKFDASKEKPILQWESPDKPVYKRTPSWYVGMVCVTLLLAFILYLQQLYSGVVLVVVGAVAISLFAGAKPRTVKCAIYPSGVVVDDKTYGFNDCKSYRISYLDLPKVRLHLTGVVAGEVILPLLNVDSQQVTAFLSKHLPEDESRGEDITDIVNRFLKF